MKHTDLTFRTLQVCPKCETEEERITGFDPQFGCYTFLCERCGKTYKAQISTYGDVGDFGRD